MKIFRIFVSTFFLCLFCFSNIVLAEVTQFVFTTSPQTIAPNATSTIITIQSQDDSGTKQNIPITSTSLTGKFFSNTAGGVLSIPVTMSKNSANKNFYYKDSTVGTHTIQVGVASIKGGPAVFYAKQDIFVGVSPQKTDMNLNNTKTVKPIERQISLEAKSEPPAEMTKEDPTQSTTTALVFEAQKKVSLIGRIFAWPIKGFNFIYRLFVGE
jgi:hypothetical protein